jgi:CRP/FNR family transcriptional regulator, anaerobic regulatory protein
MSLSPQTWQRARALYPALHGIEPQSAELQLLQAPAGATLFQQDTPCGGFPLVLAGEVQVARGAPGGRQLELYRVSPGELCVVSTSCLFGSVPLSAHGQTRQPTELLLLSPNGFHRWCSHEPFRRFVFGIFADRLADLMELAEAVAFQRLDQRLAGALLGHGPVVHATHQQIADALGTVREIVTRLLRRFEREGLVRCGREQIELLAVERLRELAAGLALIALTLTGTIGVWGWVGVVLVATAAIGFCPLYPLLGLNTCPMRKP